MKFIVYNGYPLSIVVAVTMHILLLAALLYLQSARPPEILDIMQPAMVKAILVDENPQVRNERLLEEARLVRVDEQRRQQQQEAERQRQQELAAEQQRQQEAEAARQRELEAQQRQEREAIAQQERQRQQAEERRQQEEQRERELAEQRQQEQQQQRERELAAERQRQQEAEAAAAAAVARSEFEQVQAYTGIIHDLVQRNWSRPPSARNGMTAVVRIQMAPTGDILSVEVVQSSGDAPFDRAAEDAVYRVGRFTELQGMPIRMFNDNFRTLLLTFRPEDLLN